MSLTQEIEYLLMRHVDPDNGFIDNYDAAQELMALIADATTRVGMIESSFETFVKCLRAQCELELNAIVDTKRMQQATRVIARQEA